MNARPTHTDNMLIDDVSWLESRVQRLEIANDARERKLVDCYQKLLHQRQHQLAYRDGQDGVHCGCWQDYFC